jgi:hypothetical protein
VLITTDDRCSSEVELSCQRGPDDCGEDDDPKELSEPAAYKASRAFHRRESHRA